MSEVRLNVLDSRRTLSGTVHGSEADAAVAALSAEPDTIKELQDAVAQFIKPVRGRRFFQFFETGTNAKPWDAGIVFIDLATRVVAAESSYSRPTREGQIQYHDGNRATDVSLPFFLPDDWLLAASVDEYRAVREQRRAERAAAPPFDTRAILFGAAVLEFIATECVAARGTKARDPIRQIHASWLMSRATICAGSRRATCC